MFYFFPTVISPFDTSLQIFWDFNVYRFGRQIFWRRSHTRTNRALMPVQFRMRIPLNAIIDDGQIAIYRQSEGMTYGHDIVSR